MDIEIDNLLIFFSKKEGFWKVVLNYCIKG